jgi:hypothetical protein
MLYDQRGRKGAIYKRRDHIMSIAYSKHRAYKPVEQKERWPEQLASEGPEGTYHRLSLIKIVLGASPIGGIIEISLS